MLLIEDILKFSTLSEREKFAFLSNLTPEDIMNLKDNSSNIGKSDLEKQVTNKCEDIISFYFENVYNDNVFDKRIDFYKSELEELLSAMDGQQLDEELLNKLDVFFENTYKIVLEKVFEKFKKRIVSMNNTGKNYAPLTFSFIMMQLAGKPKDNAIAWYLEDKYRRKFLEYGLDEWGLININIMRSSGYTENIEDELLFDFSKEEVFYLHRYNYSMQVTFSPTKHKQYCMEKKMQDKKQ